MINHVSITNYKSLRKVSFNLNRLTVIVGPNASGKSSILDALETCSNCLSWTNNELATHYEKLAKCVTHSSDGFAHIAISSQRYQYDTVIKPNGQVYSYDASKYIVRSYRDYSSATPDKVFTLGAQPIQVDFNPGHALKLQLEYKQLLNATFNPGNKDRLGEKAINEKIYMLPNGENMHTALASMALEFPDDWISLQVELRNIVPSVVKLRLTRDSELLFDTVNATGLTAEHVSQGTLLIVGILTAIYMPMNVKLLLIDDIDRGLHPAAQQKLIDYLKKLLDRRSDLQIVATTHSPYLLDCIEPDQIILTYLDQNGHTMCKPLSAHRDAAKWKDELLAGEMWSLFGENWVADMGGVPV
jgi:predicted ATPase